MTLSESLKQWRAERPDEWKMDEFIRQAEQMEEDYDNLKAAVNNVLGDLLDKYSIMKTQAQYVLETTKGNGIADKELRDQARAIITLCKIKE